MLRYSALLTLMACAAPAYAQAPCYPRADVIEYLTGEEYQSVFIGVAEDHKTSLNIYVNSSGWVSIVDMPNGDMCLVGSGADWQLKQTGKPA